MFILLSSTKMDSCLMKWESKRPCLKELLSTEYFVDKNCKEEGT